MVLVCLAGDVWGNDGPLLFGLMMKPHLILVCKLALRLLQVPLRPLQLVQQPAVVLVQLLQHGAPLGHLQVTMEPLQALPCQDVPRSIPAEAKLSLACAARCSPAHKPPHRHHKTGQHH